MAYAFNDDKSKNDLSDVVRTADIASIIKQAEISIAEETTITGTGMALALVMKSVSFDLSEIATIWSERNKIIGLQGIEIPAGVVCLSHSIDGIGGINYKLLLGNTTSNDKTLTPSNTKIIVSYVE